MESQSLSSRRAAHAALLVWAPGEDARAPNRRPTVQDSIPSVQLDQMKESGDSWLAENFLFIFPISLFIVIGVCAAVMSV
jgi:Flp pilus assembly protein TadB